MTCARSVLLKVRNSISIYDHTKVTSVLASVAISRHTRKNIHLQKYISNKYKLLKINYPMVHTNLLSTHLEDTHSGT